jgi:hypothetical protein
MMKVLVLLARLLTISPLLLAGDALGRDIDTDALDGVVKVLLRSIKGPVRLAVQPLDKGRSGLPIAIADRLDVEILAAIRRRIPRGVILVTRTDLTAAWAEAIEFEDRTVQDLLKEARADILVIGDARALPSKLELSFRAVSLKKGRVGRVISAPRPLELEIPELDLGDLRLHQTLWRAADELALAAASKLDAPGAVGATDIVAGGGGGAFEAYVRGLVRARMQKVLGRRNTEVAVPLGAASPNRSGLHLSLEIFDQGDAVSITMKLTGAGVAESRVARLDMGLVPVQFLPLTRDGGEIGSGMFQARGGAWITGGVSNRQAKAAAQALARARVVASALSLAMPVSRDVGTQDEMVTLRRMMERGIPHDEVWVSDVTGLDGDVSVKLRALVRGVGGPASPVVGVAFSGNDLTAGDTLKLLITAKQRPAHVAVFSWDGVDGVHLLYPSGGTKALRVERGRTLVLPPPQGPEYGVAPMLGQEVTRESLIVLASAVAFDVAGLATVPRDIGRATPFQSRPITRFFDDLARLDLDVMSLRILDYRVHAAN